MIINLLHLNLLHCCLNKENSFVQLVTAYMKYFSTLSIIELMLDDTIYVIANETPEQ